MIDNTVIHLFLDNWLNDCLSSWIILVYCCWSVLSAKTKIPRRLCPRYSFTWFCIACYRLLVCPTMTHDYDEHDVNVDEDG